MAFTVLCPVEHTGVQCDGALQVKLAIYLFLQFQINLPGCWAESPPVSCLVLPATVGARGSGGQK